MIIKHYYLTWLSKTKKVLHWFGISRVSNENGSRFAALRRASRKSLGVLGVGGCGTDEVLRELTRPRDRVLPALLSRLSLPLLGQLSSSLVQPVKQITKFNLTIF